jgi:hypothetical protein
MRLVPYIKKHAEASIKARDKKNRPAPYKNCSFFMSLDELGKAFSNPSTLYSANI